MDEDGGGDEAGFQGVESFLALRCPLPGRILPKEPGDGETEAGEVLDKAPVEVGEA